MNESKRVRGSYVKKRLEWPYMQKNLFRDFRLFSPVFYLIKGIIQEHPVLYFNWIFFLRTINTCYFCYMVKLLAKQAADKTLWGNMVVAVFGYGRVRCDQWVSLLRCAFKCVPRFKTSRSLKNLLIKCCCAG